MTAPVLWGGLLAAAAMLPLATANTYYLYLGASVAILVVVTAGLNVLAGFAGQISLGHAGFYALGAYGAALAVMRLGLSPWLSPVAGIAAAAVVGALVAAAALRVSGPYLAMVTIAFGLIVEGLLIEWVSITGGPGGIFNIPRPSLAHLYWIALGAAAVALWMTANLRRSAWGRALLAVKSSDVAAESLGLSAYHMRIVAFTVSAAFAGAGGTLFVFLNGYISPDSFTLQTSILFLLALLFGGLGHVGGPVVGSLVLTLLPELLTGLSDYRLILYGGLLLGSIYWLPTGVVGLLSGQRRHSTPPPAPPHGRRTIEPSRRPASVRAVDGRAAGPVLAAEDIAISFGGVAALDGVSLTVGEQGIFAVIGPNGAGKTTLLNVLSGYYVPAAGRVTLAGIAVTHRSPFAIARLGMARTFQTAQVFADLTVTENIAVGVAAHRLGGLIPALLGAPIVRRRERAIREQARRHAETAGLAEWADRPADALPAGSRRRLEIARALATSPRVLMLDEPAAGLGPGEIEHLDRELAALRDGGGPAIVLVEHHMDLVMAVSDHITVLDYGRVIASGSAVQVQQHPAVIEAYLGRTEPAVPGAVS